MMMTTADAITTASSRPPPAPPPIGRRRVCFSFAAYAKAVIEHLRASLVPVADGLSESEFAAIESAHAFDFPPDLRSILREGLPVGAGFPDWRSSSPHQVHLLLSLPVTRLVDEAVRTGLWHQLWGARPADAGGRRRAVTAAMEGAPTLVPIYRHFYIAARPNLAGNPVFDVRGGEVRCAGFDLADFFQREEVWSSQRGAPPLPPPAWAAKAARRVEVWTDLAEAPASGGGGMELRLREMGRRLREGGWAEEEVKEMMAGGEGERTAVKVDRESVTRHVRILGLSMLRAGWSADDVEDSLGCCDPRANGLNGIGQEALVTWQLGPAAGEDEISMDF